MRKTTPQTRQNRDHDDSNPINHNYVSCHSYHLTAVVLTILKYAVATMIPMMGGHEYTTNQGKAVTRVTRIASIDMEDNNKYSP
jgi:hypothetical protein